MDLLKRYLKAVESFLPREQPKDIIRELSENIQAQMDDQAEALGRPLTEAEQAAILKQVGNPALVAGRYRSSQLSVAFGRQLIGPALFPFYVRILGSALGLLLAAWVIVAAVLERPVLDAVASLLPILVVQFAIVTAVFAVIQSYLAQNPGVWNAWDPMAPPMRVSDAQWVSRWESMLEIGIIAVVLLWLRSDFMLTVTDNLARLLPPVWPQIYWLTVALTAAGLVPPLISLFWPGSKQFRLAARVAHGLALVAGLVYLLLAGDWAASGAEPFNLYVWYAVLIFAAVSAVVVMIDAARLWRGRVSEPRVETQ